MQSTTRFHDGITNPILEETDFVFHHPIAFHPANRVFNADSDRRDPPIAFHPANRVFNADSDRRDPPIGGFLGGSEFPPTGFFLGLEERDPLLEESLEALLLIQAAARWQGIARQLRQALIRRFAFTGMAQEANMTRLIDHEEVFERVTLLLATVILLLLFGICRAVDRTFGAIMPKRGVVDLPSVACVSNIAAHSAAVRAGSSSWSAKA